jgi:hypothetical protein
MRSAENREHLVVDVNHMIDEEFRALTTPLGGGRSSRTHQDKGGTVGRFLAAFRAFMFSRLWARRLDGECPSAVT